MSQAVARWALSVLAVLAIGAFGLIDHEFDTDNPWFFVGLTLIVVTTVAANAVLREARTRTLNDEFEAGYRVGYRAGRRASLTVARPTINNKPTSLRPKRSQKMNEPTWPDIEDSPPGSTKQR